MNHTIKSFRTILQISLIGMALCGCFRTIESVVTTMQGRGAILAEVSKDHSFVLSETEAIVLFELKGATSIAFENLDTGEQFNVQNYQPLMVVNRQLLSNPDKINKLFCIKIKSGNYRIVDFAVPNYWQIRRNVPFPVKAGSLNYLGSWVVDYPKRYIKVNDESQMIKSRLVERYPRAKDKEIVCTWTLAGGEYLLRGDAQ